MKSIFGKLKKGIKVMKDKTMDAINNIGSTLKDKESRLLVGLTFVGVGTALIVSLYIRIPQ